jgi:hypothetical protein
MHPWISGKFFYNDKNNSCPHGNCNSYNHNQGKCNDDFSRWFWTRCHASKWVLLDPCC